MMVQGKRSAISQDDFTRLAELMGISRTAFESIIGEVNEALLQWPDFARQSGIGSGLAKVVNTSIRSMVEQL